MYSCKEVKTNLDKEFFLKLPELLYEKKFLTNIKDIEKHILDRTHPLSCDFKIYPYIVLNDKNQIAARAILTKYSNDERGYVGFFESINSVKAVDCLINTIKDKARELGLKRLIGPIDCSIWIKYRFKVDNFDEYYSSEPYNLPYYADLWKSVGFEITDKYFSNRLKVPTEEVDTTRVLDLMKKRGIEIKNPTPSTLDKYFNDLYGLIVDLYSNFVGFKPITKAQYTALFSEMKKILKLDMAFAAYKDGEMVAFHVIIPNYGVYGNDINIFTMPKLLSIRNNPKEYIMLYMGANSKGMGAGSAFTVLEAKKMKEYNTTCINALVHEGNSSGRYYDNLLDKKFNYVMMGLEL